MTLDTFLKRAGMTGEKLASLVGVSAAQISRIRSGKSGCSWEVARSIETHTNGQVKADAVMDGFLTTKNQRTRKEARQAAKLAALPNTGPQGAIGPNNP